MGYRVPWAPSDALSGIGYLGPPTLTTQTDPTSKGGQAAHGTRYCPWHPIPPLPLGDSVRSKGREPATDLSDCYGIDSCAKRQGVGDFLNGFGSSGLGCLRRAEREWLGGTFISCCCTSTGEEWHIRSFNAQPEAPAFLAAGPGKSRCLRLGVKRVTLDRERYIQINPYRQGPQAVQGTGRASPGRLQPSPAAK